MSLVYCTVTCLCCRLLLKCQSTTVVSGREDTKFTHSPIIKLSNLLTRNVATGTYRALTYRALTYRALTYRALTYRSLTYRLLTCYGLFPLPDSDSDMDSYTMQDFSIGSDSDSVPVIEMYVLDMEICS